MEVPPRGYETKYNKTRSVLAQIRISKTRPAILLLHVKILQLRTQNVHVRVRTSTGLEKVRVEILSQNCTLLNEFNTKGSGKIAMGKKGNILGIDIISSYIFKSCDCWYRGSSQADRMDSTQRWVFWLVKQSLLPFENVISCARRVIDALQLGIAALQWGIDALQWGIDAFQWGIDALQWGIAKH